LQDYSTFPVIFRVTDSHGFRGYAGVIIEATKGTLHFVDNTGRENPIPISDTITDSAQPTSSQKSNMFIVLMATIGCICIALLVFIAKKSFLQKTKRTSEV